MKIAILGYSGSGKSTLAKQFRTFYNLPVLHLDTIQFTTNWQERDRQEAIQLVAQFMENTNWVIEGNYSEFLQERRLEEADQIIILDFPKYICLWRAFTRYLKNKNKTRDDMATGCIEKFDFEFLIWILFEGRTSIKRQHYKKIADKYPSKTSVIKNPKAMHLFLDKINGA